MTRTAAPQPVAEPAELSLHPDTPCVVAAQRVLDLRLRAVEKLMKAALEPEQVSARHVHQLRVATRRAGAALRLFRPFFRQKALKRLAAELRAARRAVAVARRDDVHAETLESHCHPAQREAIDSELRRSRTAAVAGLHDLGERGACRRLARARRKLLHSIRRRARRDAGVISAPEPFVLSELAAAALPPMIAPLAVPIPEHLADFSELHALRLNVKRLRYSLEVVSECLPPRDAAIIRSTIEDAQTRLGEINDYRELTERTRLISEAIRDDSAPGPGNLTAIRALSESLATQAEAMRSQFLNWWSGDEALSAVSRLRALFPEPRSEPAVIRFPRQAQREVALDRPPPPAYLEPPPLLSQAHPHRIAAIDVGSNSVRMVVAETDPETRFRIIEDVRETTRLAGGLFRTGKLSTEAMDAALAALCRIREIAEHHHVDRLKAVGTSAVREARNAGKFLRTVERETGIRIDPIDAEYEARLAFSSVARAFDLEGKRAVSIDLGGGSADVVVSDSGLIESLHTLPLGAVRLTDMFSDATNPGVYRFSAMSRYVGELIHETLGEPRGVDLFVGTGGTFTTLARIAIRRGAAGHGEGRFPFAVRGYEVPYSELRAILKWLRDLSHEERRRVPGLSDRRSEIIVAGLCVVERLMRHFGVEFVRVHDGGIREGLLMEMIDELHLIASAPERHDEAALFAVRRLAERSEYPREHSEHVARLALRIFDQLALVATDRAAAWAQPGARELLHAAALLHDVGLLIEFRGHHKHSYTMITHADLSPLTRRQVEIVATISRYHRRAGPSPGHGCYQRLSVDDQHLVRDLAGILRIADGLDRLHDQRVRDVRVRTRGRLILFDVTAAADATPCIAAARKKSSVLAEAFEARVVIEAVAAAARELRELHHAL